MIRMYFYRDFFGSMNAKHAFWLFGVLAGSLSCSSSAKFDLDELEPLHVAEFNTFKAGHLIEEKEPSMEQIALSMCFLKREDPLEIRHIWFNSGHDEESKGEDWIDLFQGDGEYQAIAIERLQKHDPLKVRVITWIRKNGPWKNSPYELPFLRHEYYLDCEQDGWRKRRKVVKSGAGTMDRTYSYDSFTVSTPGKGRVLYSRDF